MNDKHASQLYRICFVAVANHAAMPINTHRGGGWFLNEDAIAQRNSFTSLKLSCLYILVWADQPMCVQPVQNTSQENIVLQDTILLYTKEERLLHYLNI